MTQSAITQQEKDVFVMGMPKYHKTIKSGNLKTGNISVTTSDESTCPPLCPFKHAGCFGDDYHLRMHWDHVTVGDRGVSFDDFLASVESIPDYAIWRHNQVGDLPGRGNRINVKQLAQLVLANGKSKGFTYTHKPDTPTNVRAIRAANEHGFTVNLSANNVAHADKLAGHGLPIAVVLPSDYREKVSYTPNGHKIILCPNSSNKKIQCKSCAHAFCANADRDFIVGLPAHGGKISAVNLIARG